MRYWEYRAIYSSNYNHKMILNYTDIKAYLKWMWEDEGFFTIEDILIRYERDLYV